MNTTAFRNVFRRQLAVVALGLSAALMPALAFADSPVEPAMKHMQRAYGQALRSVDVVQLQSALAVLHQYADVAGSLQYGRTADARGTYQDGIRELQADLADVDAALARNDLMGQKRFCAHKLPPLRKCTTRV